MNLKFNANSAESVAQILKAIAHPIRLLILDTLEGSEKCVGQVADDVGVLQSVASGHLEIMKDRGVVTARRCGTKVYYAIADMNVIRIMHCVSDNCKMQE